MIRARLGGGLVGRQGSSSNLRHQFFCKTKFCSEVGGVISVDFGRFLGSVSTVDLPSSLFHHQVLSCHLFVLFLALPVSFNFSCQLLSVLSFWKYRSMWRVINLKWPEQNTRLLGIVFLYFLLQIDITKLTTVNFNFSVSDERIFLNFCWDSFFWRFEFNLLFLQIGSEMYLFNFLTIF